MLAHKLQTKQTNLDIHVYKGCNEAPPPQHLPEEKYTFVCIVKIWFSWSYIFPWWWVTLLASASNHSRKKNTSSCCHLNGLDFPHKALTDKWNKNSVRSCLKHQKIFVFIPLLKGQKMQTCVKQCTAAQKTIWLKMIHIVTVYYMGSINFVLCLIMMLKFFWICKGSVGERMWEGCRFLVYYFACFDCKLKFMPFCLNGMKS